MGGMEGPKIVDPNAYLCALYEEFPDEVLATITGSLPANADHPWHHLK